MALKANELLLQQLNKRSHEDNLRRLTTTNGLTDFCSNDYLGLSRSLELQKLVEAAYQALPDKYLGSTGSRLLAGNSACAEELEHDLAQLYHAEAGLLFGSGYMANLALLSSVPKRGDLIIYDALSHASIKDGLRLSQARYISFRHNDLTDLRKKIQLAGAKVWVVVESVYSMDGDVAPLADLVALCEENHADLIVDEAHSTGLFGTQGEGMVAALRLQSRVFARVFTFGKALGAHGAFVAGSNVLRSFLINFARPLIYTTALPLHSLVNIGTAVKYVADNELLRVQLRQNIQLFSNQLASAGLSANSQTAIQPVMVQGNANVKALASYCQNHGLDVRAICSPTVAAGNERLRICLHSFNKQEDIITLVKILAKSKLNTVS